MNNAAFAQKLVRSLVAGLRPSLRGGARIVILQACIDDSRSPTQQQERMYLLGGLIAEVDQWEQLAFAWEEELNREPVLGYFKFSQALSMKDEFHPDRGWTEDKRDARVLAFADLIAKRAEMGVVSFLSETSYNRLVKPLSDFKPLRTPYFLLFHHMTELVSRQMVNFPDMQKLQYVFDKQGNIGDEAIGWWDRISSAAKNRSGIPFHGSTPIPQDEKDFLPLQAADLYAGASRNDIEGKWSPLIRECAARFNGMRKRSVAAEYTQENLLNFAARLVVR